MIKKIIGGLLIASPFIAITLLPLYYPGAEWSAIGTAWGVSLGIVAVMVGGLYLLCK